MLWAGPPFQTDDPLPVPFRHWEFYLFATRDGTAIGSARQGPAIELNYGVYPDVQLHLIVPTAGFSPADGHSGFGIGDTEIGVKYRFLHERKHRPQIGFYPFVELPTGDASQGLGNGRVWYRLTLWVQKSAGPWTTYGGAGVVVNSAPGMRNFPVAGWLLQKDLNKKWTLGGEVFTHGPEGPESLSVRSSVLFDFGGYYCIRKPGFQVLFMGGHSVTGQPEAVAYLGLYWTWGRGNGGSHPHSFLGRLHGRY